MERIEFLKLCQMNAVYPKSRKVIHDDIDYYPIEYILGYDKVGEATHTARLRSVNAGQCDVFVRLKEVEPFGKE